MMPFNNILAEICRASTIKAVVALSKFLQLPIGIDTKSIVIKPVNKINFFKKSQEIITLFLPIKGAAPGASLLFYDKNDAFSLCDVILKRKHGATTVISELEISALSEIANIIMGNFLNCFAQSFKIDFMHSIAIYDCSSSQDIINKLPDNFSLGVCVTFSHINIKGNILFMFDEDKMLPLLRKIANISNVKDLAIGKLG